MVIVQCLLGAFVLIYFSAFDLKIRGIYRSKFSIYFSAFDLKIRGMYTSNIAIPKNQFCS